MKKETTSFTKFCGGADFDNNQEKAALYQAVYSNTISYPFICVETEKGYEVSSTDMDLKLILGSELARETFLNHIKTNYFGGLDFDIWNFQNGKAA